MKGRINSIQTLGTLDGPGVRFVLFMQGCPLRCAFCHNPDTWDISGGEEKDADEIVAMVGRYREYLGKDGGITLSGGEPLLQADFVYELFDLCKKANIHTALDTSGCIWDERVDRLLSVTDLCLLDYKMTTDEQYRKHVGCSISAPEMFLEKLEERSVSTWLRQVIISGVNDSAESVIRLRRLAEKHSCVKKIELLKFRKLCAPKYENLGIEFPFGNLPETKAEDISAIMSAIGKR